MATQICQAQKLSGWLQSVGVFGDFAEVIRSRLLLHRKALGKL
jgi:hypothetical protein